MKTKIFVLLHSRTHTVTLCSHLREHPVGFVGLVRYFVNITSDVFLCKASGEKNLLGQCNHASFNVRRKQCKTLCRACENLCNDIIETLDFENVTVRVSYDTRNTSVAVAHTGECDFFGTDEVNLIAQQVQSDIIHKKKKEDNPNNNVGLCRCSNWSA